MVGPEEAIGVPEETIALIRSFHLCMQATIRLEGSLLEQISVENELHHGRVLHGSCAIQPIYTCLAVERRLVRMEGVEGLC